MPPELHVLLLIISMIGVAYGLIFPRMEPKTLKRMMIVDLILGGGMLVIAGSVYGGSDVRFSLLLMSVPWWVFVVVVAAIVEIPLFLWFCKKWDIDPGGD